MQKKILWDLLKNTSEQYISVAASFSTNHHWRHRMGSSKLHPKNAIELWGLFVSKLPNYFHILQEIIVPLKCILRYLDPIYTSVWYEGFYLQAGRVRKGLSCNRWRVSWSPIRNKCTENEVKVKFDEETKFPWNNISIIATVLGGIMLATHWGWITPVLGRGWDGLAGQRWCTRWGDRPGGLMAVIKRQDYFSLCQSSAVQCSAVRHYGLVWQSGRSSCNILVKHLGRYF